MANSKLKELLLITDDRSWLIPYVQNVGSKLGEFLRLRPTASIRQSWARFKNAPAIIIHWESKARSGGALVEEILEVDPYFDVAKKIIILTSDPVHEDVVYFSELGLKKIIRVRNRAPDNDSWSEELRLHIADAIADDTVSTNVEIHWRKILRWIDSFSQPCPPEKADSLLEKILRLQVKGQNQTARELDALGSAAFFKNNFTQALNFWEQALQKNPNYFRSYNNIIKLYRFQNQPTQALAFMQKMHQLNKSRVARLVAMGEVHLELHDEKKAEHCFRAALERDAFASGALNGLAEVKFFQGDLEETKRLLHKSSLAYRTSQKLNAFGIEMVKRGNYQEALKHYSNAQYVLPQQEKGAQLFYNIGLCYSRWGKEGMAKEFLKLSLIKEPTYKKAQKLLDQLSTVIAA